MTSPWGKVDKDIGTLLVSVQRQGAIITKRGGHIKVKGGTGQMVTVNTSNANPRIWRDIRSDLRRAGWVLT